MIRPGDESWVKNNEEYKARREAQWWKWRANNLDAQHIIALWKDMYDWDINKVNEVLEEKWFDRISNRPVEWDELYIDF